MGVEVSPLATPDDSEETLVHPPYNWGCRGTILLTKEADGLQYKPLHLMDLTLAIILIHFTK